MPGMQHGEWGPFMNWVLPKGGVLTVKDFCKNRKKNVPVKKREILH